MKQSRENRKTEPKANVQGKAKGCTTEAAVETTPDGVTKRKYYKSNREGI